MTTFSTYQSVARTTAIYRESCPTKFSRIAYAALGLSDEVGETHGKLKKFLRDKEGLLILEHLHEAEFVPADKETYEALRLDVMKELGDVLWYLALLADELDLSLDEVAQMNLEKLLSRQERGTLRGSGDDR